MLRCAWLRWRSAAAPQPYRSETAALVDALLTRQAVRTLLHYASETNGEIHLFLNEYLADHPLTVDAQNSAKAWLSELAAQPLARLSDPGRSSAPSAAGAAQTGEAGVREVSPRDVVERILALRLDVAAEVATDLGAVREANAQVLRATLARTVSEQPPLED